MLFYSPTQIHSANDGGRFNICSSTNDGSHVVGCLKKKMENEVLCVMFACVRCKYAYSQMSSILEFRDIIKCLESVQPWL